MNQFDPTLSLAVQEQANQPKPYRRDIDGLRAIAVVAVILYHAAVPGFSGGFVGVDIFFVISGYLIGGIVHRDVDAGRFSFASFYARRARRIVPALIAVILATLALGLLLLGPAELARYAVSAIAASLGLSNLWFLHSADYFAPDARLEPLLMTWSLGIEEQFYVLLPPLLLLARHWRVRQVALVVLAVTVGSLALAAWAAPQWPVESFYLLPTRAWELGMGVALAMLPDLPRALSRQAQTIMGGVGLAMIVLAVALFDETARFPGVAALVPTLGTAMLIAARGGWVNVRLLTARPIVGIGLISYSWYLWHWPLLALLRICAAVPVAAPVLATVAFGSLLPAYISWRWIETPFRRPTTRRSDGTQLVRFGFVLGGTLAVLGGVAALHGFPGRIGPRGNLVEGTLQANGGKRCLASYGRTVASLDPACLPTGQRPRIALLGDSHAAALGESLRSRAAAHGFDLLQLNATSCPPLLGATRSLPEHPGASAACGTFNEEAIARVLRDEQISTVIMTGFWQAPFGTRARVVGEAYVDLRAKGTPRTRERVLYDSLGRTLAAFRATGKRVVLLGDVPWLRFDPARDAYARFLPLRAAIETGVSPRLDPANGSVSRDFVEPLSDEGSAITARAARDMPGVTFVALRDFLCDGTNCRVGDRGLPYFIDQQHLSRPGADHVVGMLDPLIWPAASR